MGGLTAAMAAAAPLVRRRDPHRGCRSPGSPSRGGQVTGVVLRRRRRAARAAGRHDGAPEDRLPRARSTGDELPADFVADIERWNTPLGHGEDQPRRRPAARVHRRSPGSTPRCTAARSCSPARSTRSRGPSRTPWPAARPRAPVRRHLHPVGVRPHAGPRGPPHRVDVHAVGAARVGRQADARRARRLRRPRRRRPSKRWRRGSPISILHRHGDRPARDGARVRPRRRQHLPRRAVDRTSCSTCARRPGYADFRTPDRAASTRPARRPTAAAASPASRRCNAVRQIERDEQPAGVGRR